MSKNCNFILHQSSIFQLNPCPDDPRFINYENTVDPDQLASNEAICSVSTLFSTLLVTITGMAQNIRMKLARVGM